MTDEQESTKDRPGPRGPPESEPKSRSFLAIYCEREQIPAGEFTRSAFNRVLMRKKRFLADLARKSRPCFFDEDEQLIQVCGAKHTMEEVRKEISEYFADRHYWG